MTLDAQEIERAAVTADDGHPYDTACCEVAHSAGQILRMKQAVEAIEAALDYNNSWDEVERRLRDLIASWTTEGG